MIYQEGAAPIQPKPPSSKIRSSVSWSSGMTRDNYRDNSRDVKTPATNAKPQVVKQVSLLMVA